MQKVQCPVVTLILISGYRMFELKNRGKIIKKFPLLKVRDLLLHFAQFLFIYFDVDVNFENVHVVHINSPGSFYVHLTRSRQQLQKLSDDLYAHIRSLAPTVHEPTLSNTAYIFSESVCIDM